MDTFPSLSRTAGFAAAFYRIMFKEMNSDFKAYLDGEAEDGHHLGEAG